MKNKYEINGNVTTIFINYQSGIIKTVIDTEDLPIAQSFKGTWRVMKTSGSKNKLYVYGAYSEKKEKYKSPVQKTIYLSRLLMGFPEGLVVDHINNDSLDNRRSVNLQAITIAENVRKEIPFRKKPERVKRPQTRVFPLKMDEYFNELLNKAVENSIIKSKHEYIMKAIAEKIERDNKAG